MALDQHGAALAAHLKTGVTTVCRCWAVTPRNGTAMGFTDHDRTLSFEGLTFAPDAGMEASTLVQTTGLSVDNAEGLGILSDDAISEHDILAGRYDEAKVESWLVNWADVSARSLIFQGTIGEVRWSNGAYRAELRGLTEMLNQPQGLVYQKPCSAVLGDARCGVDLTSPTYRAEVLVAAVLGNRQFSFAGLGAYEAGWFARGKVEVLTGEAAGLIGVVKADRDGSDGRDIELWQEFLLPVQPGDLVRVEAGCDRRGETCRTKFNNFVNYRGFPDIPGEDWITSYPKRSSDNSGGSRKLSSLLTDAEVPNVT